MSGPYKTLGQVAYEAYCEAAGGVSLMSGAKLPPWQELGEAIQRAWIEAAHAVVTEAQ